MTPAWSYLGTNNDSLSTNDNGSRLLSMSQECNLYILNSFYDSKPIHRHTWYSPTGFSKRVDYLLADWHIKKLSTNCRVYRKASIPFESDHRLLVLHCSFPSKSEQKQFFRKPLTKKPFTKISCLKDNQTVSNNFSKKLDDLLVDEPLLNNIDAFKQSFTESIRLASEEMIPKNISSSKVPP